MTPKEIAAHLLNQTTLNGDTLAPLHDYHEAKRATGAPTDLEYEILAAASELDRATVDLYEYLTKAQKETADMREAINAHGVKFGRCGATWFSLNARHSAETLHNAQQSAHQKFSALLRAWVTIADRIVATDEDRAAHAEKARERRASALSSMTARELRAMAREKGLKVGTEKSEIVAAILAAEEADGLLDAAWHEHNLIHPLARFCARRGAWRNV